VKELAAKFDKNSQSLGKVGKGNFRDESPVPKINLKTFNLTMNEFPP